MLTLPAGAERFMRIAVKLRLQPGAHINRPESDDRRFSGTKKRCC